MTDTEKAEVRELVSKLVDKIRCNSSRIDEHAAILADVLRYEHRTHQQTVLGVIQVFLGLYGDFDHDMRNEAAVTWAKKAAYVVSPYGFPFI